MVWTSRSGRFRTNSTCRRPCSRLAPDTSTPSASTKLRWNWRAAMPRCKNTRSPVFVGLFAADHKLGLLHGDVEICLGKSCHSQRDAVSILAALFNIVRRIPVVPVFHRAFHQPVQLIEPKQEWVRRKRKLCHSKTSPLCSDFHTKAPERQPPHLKTWDQRRHKARVRLGTGHPNVDTANPVRD